MDPFGHWRKTDAEVIKQARRWLHWRRPVGVVCMLLAIGFLAYGGYGFQHLYRTWSEGFERDEQMAADMATDGVEPVKVAEMRQIVEEGERWMGLIFGFGLGALTAFGLSLLATGIDYTFRPDRKTQLLIELWDAPGQRADDAKHR